MGDITTPRRRLPAPQRRATLVKAASELFAERGYDHVSLDEVAEKSGVTKVIVYRHFASKKDLYLQLLAAIARLLEAEPGLQLPSSMVEPAAELLRSAMTGLALWWLEHQDVARDALVDAIVLTTWHGFASRSK